MRNTLLAVLLMLPPVVHAVDEYNPKTGRVLIPVVIVGQVRYTAIMKHQGDLVFKVTTAITTPSNTLNPDIYNLETETLYMPNVSVGSDNYEVFMAHQGDLVFKVTKAAKIETGRFIDSPVVGLSYRY